MAKKKTKSERKDACQRENQDLERENQDGNVYKFPPDINGMFTSDKSR